MTRRNGSGSRGVNRSQRLPIELLESRQLLATFSVTNLHDSGPGSLRQAILDANVAPGADTIDFGVSGTIAVGRRPLPPITHTVSIDGTTAPSFAGSPVVTVDFRGTKGLDFAPGSDGSTLRSISLVKARGAGVTLDASFITVQGNYIGLLADGSSVAGNRGDGIRINRSSHGDVIGKVDPVTSTDFYNTSSVSIQPVTAWQGIRASDTSGQYLITGTSDQNGLLYIGPITGSGGTSYAVNYPGAVDTSVYGPDLLHNGGIRLVGSYKNGDGTVHGFLFNGSTSSLSQASDYRTIDYPGAKYTYVHSVMGTLAVGNADGPEGNAPIGTGHAFLYDVGSGTIVQDIVYPGSTSTTAYGIWHNSGTNYTICGGYSTPLNGGPSVSSGYLVDYDSKTHQFTNWTSFNYQNGPVGQDLITHFEGISSVEKGVYTLAADTLQAGPGSANHPSWVTVRRNPDGTFGTAIWDDLSDPNVPGGLTANSVSGNQVVGIILGSTGSVSYQASINTGFQLSNVISGNGGNGIGIYGAHGNRIAMNNIGTDATGTLARGNAKNGILVTQHATGNTIGGQATGGNDPTGSVFVRPPQGNLISGNHANGVLINKGSNRNLLSGNFVGTTASGNSALGNRLDGVAIDHANGNQLIGCTYQQNPFVFYNVLSGNGGNGLTIHDSNDTTVQANFLGAGANNAVIVPNGNDGLLISGSSTNTQVGGVIPLGNVISGNTRNGIEVTDTARGFISFNTFGGTFAFGGAAPNGHDGILITSRGGNNLIRTCIVSGNLGNGIELGGQATGVQITETAVGTNTAIQSAIPNAGDGIKISGHAHDNAIGGFQPSVEPHVTISANGGYGIDIVGAARRNAIFHTDIGANAQETVALGNARGGIYVGPGTSGTRIGGPSTRLAAQVLNNGGPGVFIQTSRGNILSQDEIRGNAGGGVVIVGAPGRRFCVGQPGNLVESSTIVDNGTVGVAVSGNVTGARVQTNLISGNAGNGVTLSSAQGVIIGGSKLGTGNTIQGNQGFGLYASGNSFGSVVQANTIRANTKGNVNISNAQGLIFIP